jgi:hypothetical protein
MDKYPVIEVSYITSMVLHQLIGNLKRYLTIPRPTGTPFKGGLVFHYLSLRMHESRVKNGEWELINKNHNFNRPPLKGVPAGGGCQLLV